MNGDDTVIGPNGKPMTFSEAEAMRLRIIAQEAEKLAADLRRHAEMIEGRKLAKETLQTINQLALRAAGKDKTS
jgi:hypothetical protein